MFKYIAIIFAILAFIGFTLSNLLTVELLDAMAPIFNAKTPNTNL